MKNYLVFPFFIYFIAFSCLCFSQETNTPSQQKEFFDETNEKKVLKNQEETTDKSYSDIDREQTHLFGTTPTKEYETPDFEHRFFNMLIMLAILIGFMLLAAWALKRMMKNRLNNMNISNQIKIVETRSISPRSTLYLIEINGQTLLIAETHQSITHLASLDSETSE